ncbi:class A beta-lactamase [uncultured Sphingomonas sp.]|uniref:class A beta-lactamase n=1 Tax=uncultured Sphingomonas sp. TaxID=158754 RepID=UPI0035C9AECF
MLRRSFLTGAACVVAGPIPAGASSSSFGGLAFRREVLALERASRGRLGVAILDTGTGARFDSRGDERFALCSTFKLILAAAILARVDRNGDRLDRRVPIAASDLVPNSPFTETRVGGDATVAELCLATMTRSDNAAANLLLPAVGGPAGVTRFARALGDDRTRLDRIEPELNDVRPGDPRDTTTPDAMLGLFRTLTLGPVLKPVSRARFTRWLVANKTGDPRLRAGLPRNWRVGDKTGASGRGHDNDVAILWPPARRPLLVASYIADSPLDLAASNIIHARLGGLIARAVA